MFESGDFNAVPTMIGLTKDEGIYASNYFFKNQDKFRQFWYVCITQVILLFFFGWKLGRIISAAKIIIIGQVLLNSFSEITWESYGEAIIAFSFSQYWIQWNLARSWYRHRNDCWDKKFKNTFFKILRNWDCSGFNTWLGRIGLPSSKWAENIIQAGPPRFTVI